MKDEIESILLRHWVEEWKHHHYPIAVRCMAEGCDWEGRFPGDIAGHNAELIVDFINSISEQGIDPTPHSREAVTAGYTAEPDRRDKHSEDL